MNEPEKILIGIKGEKQYNSIFNWKTITIMHIDLSGKTLILPDGTEIKFEESKEKYNSLLGPWKYYNKNICLDQKIIEEKNIG